MQNLPGPEAFLQEIEKNLSQRAFIQADTLYKKLLDAHPMAIPEIMAAGNLIEEAKTDNLDLGHLKMWSDLYKELSDEETNSVYYNLRKATFPEKKQLLKHGSGSNKLFFIESGEVIVFLTKDDKHQGIVKLGPGDVLGEYCFTSISLCSASAVTRTEVTCRYVDAKLGEIWERDFPGLLEKMVGFCKRTGRVENALSTTKWDKRSSQREKANCKIVMTLIKEGVLSEDYMRGYVSDISEGGCCVELHLSSRERAKSLLGEEYNLVFDCEMDPCIGTIVRVSSSMYGDYTAHISFAEKMDAKDLEAIRQAGA